VLTRLVNKLNYRSIPHTCMCHVKVIKISPTMQTHPHNAETQCLRSAIQITHLHSQSV